MQESVKQRLDVAKEVFRRRWFRNLLLIWAAISFWDTFVSEMLPEKIAANAPRVYKVIFWLLEMTSGWIPWWGWLLVGMSMLVIGSIEFAFRVAREEQLRRGYLQPSASTEKGRLDYLVEGVQAINDLTNALVRDCISLSDGSSRQSMDLAPHANKCKKRLMQNLQLRRTQMNNSDKANKRFDQLLHAMVTQPAPSEKLAKEGPLRRVLLVIDQAQRSITTQPPLRIPFSIELAQR
jgi:hypothetical protein